MTSRLLAFIPFFRKRHISRTPSKNHLTVPCLMECQPSRNNHGIKVRHHFPFYPRLIVKHFSSTSILLASTSHSPHDSRAHLTSLPSHLLTLTHPPPAVDSVVPNSTSAIRAARYSRTIMEEWEARMGRRGERARVLSMEEGVMGIMGIRGERRMDQRDWELG